MPLNDGLKTQVVTPYSEAFKEQCFIAWYSAGCPTKERFGTIMPADEIGRHPSNEVIYTFMKTRSWRERADVLNEEVSRQIEKKAVEVRVEMLNRQAEIGKTLQEMGMEFLEENGFKKAGEALKALISGAELERSSRGLPQAIMKIAELENSELSSILSNLMNKAGSGGELEDSLKFDIEAQFTEVTDDADSGE